MNLRLHPYPGTRSLLAPTRPRGFPGPLGFEALERGRRRATEVGGDDRILRSRHCETLCLGEAFATGATGRCDSSAPAVEPLWFLELLDQVQPLSCA